MKHDEFCLNALSSIVCFLTFGLTNATISFTVGLNALSSIVCFLTYVQALVGRRLNCVSMPSRALYAF